MSDLMVLVTEAAPPSLRGRLAVWLIEVRSGVYVGVYSVRVREYIWEQVVFGMGKSHGNVIMIWKDRTEEGFSVRSIGRTEWRPVDFDGVTLMGYLHQ